MSNSQFEVIDQSSTILDLTPDAMVRIERAARTCYKSEDRITVDSAAKLVKQLRRNGHWPMLEFGNAMVRFVTNRGVTHEMVRHRLCSFAQESTRYVNYNKKGMQYIRPVWWDEWTQFDRDDWLESAVEDTRRYNASIKRGNPPQIARDTLPNCLKTEIVVLANFVEWIHIFKLRTSKKAHPQLRALMIPVQDEFIKRCPEIFGPLKD